MLVYIVFNGYRVQVTDVDGTISVAKVITLSSAVKYKLLLYAADKFWLASGEDLVEIEATLSSELESVNDWLIDNKLSLHLGKKNNSLCLEQGQITQM